MTDQVHVNDDIPAYALGVLDALERDRVETHLAGCPACQVELHAYQEVVTAISTSAPLIQPPAHLKGAILKQIQTQPSPDLSRDTSKKAGFRVSLINWLRLAPAMSFAAALVIVVLVASNLLLWKQVSDLSAMQRHGYSSVILNSTNKAPEARGMIVYTLDGKSGFLVVNGLKSLPASQQYQLWLVKSGQRTSGGIFSVDQDGYQVLEINSRMLLTAYDSFGITIEPEGGSPGPTGDKVLGGKF